MELFKFHLLHAVDVHAVPPPDHDGDAEMDANPDNDEKENQE